MFAVLQSQMHMLCCCIRIPHTKIPGQILLYGLDGKFWNNHTRVRWKTLRRVGIDGGKVRSVTNPEFCRSSDDVIVIDIFQLLQLVVWD